MIRVALLVALALLAFSGTAAAMSGDRAGVVVGEQVWGTPPCGRPSIEVSTPGAYLSAYGTGNFTSDPEAWADETRCAIVLNPRYVIHTAAKRCHVIVHEWGHLAGYVDPSNTADPTHSDNPRSVMYATDLVAESREFLTRKRFRWVAGGAFRPCYLMTQPGHADRLTARRHVVH